MGTKSKGCNAACRARKGFQEDTVQSLAVFVSPSLTSGPTWPHKGEVGVPA